MDIQVGHFYQDRGGRTVKVLAREQKFMRPLTAQFQADLDARKVRPVDDDRAQVDLLDYYRCWPGSDEDPEEYYVTLKGQACLGYKLVSGEALRYAFPTEGRQQDQADLVREVHPSEVEQQQFEQRTFHATRSIAISLKIQAQSVTQAYDQFPSKRALLEALDPLLASTAIEIEDISYDHSQDEIEEDEE